MSPSPVNAPPHVHTLLSSLHAKSLAQEAALTPDTFTDRSADSFHALMQDKFIALEQDKCEFVYQLLRATRATTVVEAGTSYGVSTIYLALAVARNASASRTKGKVIATEYEPGKATVAREHWNTAGEEIASVIELREGDLRETLKREDYNGVDFLLLDIWTPMALPTLKLVQPRMRAGAVIVADNTVMAKESYKELFDYVDQEGGPFRRITLPFKGGMDMIVYEG